MDNVSSFLTEFALTIGLRLLAAIAIVIVGRWLARAAARLVERSLLKSETDVALTRFGKSLTYYGVMTLVFIAALAAMGIETTTFAAVIAAAGLAVGMALQGALGNFAAGVLILLFRPFKVGHLVEIADKWGTVEDIQIINTVLVTFDNKTVIIPNAQVMAGPITNYSAKGVIRLDLVFGIGYADDLLKAKTILLEILSAHDKVLTDPAPGVSVLELGDSSVNFAVRPYIRVEDYWPVHFDITEQVKLRFDAEGISIPFPQQDVHLYQGE